MILIPHITPRGQVVGYARVSSRDQNLDRQIAALGDVDRMFADKKSGKNTDREQLQEMLAYVRAGDTIRVKSADRLARSTIDLLTLLHELGERGVSVSFVDNPTLSTDSKEGKFMLTLLGAVAELERDMIRERQAEGIAIAKAKGTYRRAPALSIADVHRIDDLIAQGVPKTEIARQLGVSRWTVQTAANRLHSYETYPRKEETTDA